MNNKYIYNSGYTEILYRTQIDLIGSKFPALRYSYRNIVLDTNVKQHIKHPNGWCIIILQTSCLKLASRYTHAMTVGSAGLVWSAAEGGAANVNSLVHVLNRRG